MRVTVFHNSIPASIKAAQKLLKLLKNGHFELDERHPQVVITIAAMARCCQPFTVMPTNWIRFALSACIQGI